MTWPEEPGWGHRGAGENLVRRLISESCHYGIDIFHILYSRHKEILGCVYIYTPQKRSFLWLENRHYNGGSFTIMVVSLLTVLYLERLQSYLNSHPDILLRCKAKRLRDVRR